MREKGTAQHRKEKKPAQAVLKGPCNQPRKLGGKKAQPEGPAAQGRKGKEDKTKKN